MMTTFGLLFGGLRLIQADTPVYLFFGSLAVSISAAQMVIGKLPQAFPALLGGLLLPCWLMGQAAYGGQDLASSAVGLPCTIVMGSVLGYCTGVLAVGVFALIQMAESFLRPTIRARESAFESSQSNGESEEDFDA